MSFPRYPKYKESGVEWLGDVPEGWEVKRLDFLASVKARLGWKGLTASEYVPEGFIFLATPNIKGEREIDFINVNYITAERYYESPEIMVQVGDVLIAKDGSTLGTTNVVRHLPAPTTVNSSIAVLRPKPELNSSYCFRWITSSYLQSVIQSMKDGQGVPHLFQEDIRKFSVLLPPLSEQKTIAEFLDRETRKIDDLVAEQQQLIELLKEKRQAVISHAVTKGLNPHAPMKPSGIEWLGDVPEGWEVTRIGFLCCKIGSGKTPLGGGEAYVTEGILFIRSQNVYDDGMHLDDVVYVSEETDAEQPWSRVVSGDILLNITGASLGRTCLVPDNFQAANVNQHVCILRLLSSTSRHFVSMVLKSSGMKAQFDAAQNGAAREGLNFAQISKLALAVPPAAEQTEILKFLDTELAKFDTLTTEAQHAIDLLQERRTALISAAVTGQIDVRKPPKN
jgi:type I restriction enzyme S subunit